MVGACLYRFFERTAKSQFRAYKQNILYKYNYGGYEQTPVSVYFIDVWFVSEARNGGKKTLRRRVEEKKHDIPGRKSAQKLEESTL